MDYEPISREELIRQGSCCGNCCKNCPYIPRNKKGSTKID
ncbi:MAG TPA: DUF5522 domain-containing protein [Candidatus Nanoarchaeia archaeon]|nr:DUF5522 domain-containing protein [Candidatus Nanoarchaeia archaeon]